MNEKTCLGVAISYSSDETINPLIQQQQQKNTTGWRDQNNSKRYCQNSENLLAPRKILTPEIPKFQEFPNKIHQGTENAKQNLQNS